jgi:hypothetical protein
MFGKDFEELLDLLIIDGVGVDQLDEAVRIFDLYQMHFK